MSEQKRAFRIKHLHMCGWNYYYGIANLNIVEFTFH